MIRGVWGPQAVGWVICISLLPVAVALVGVRGPEVLVGMALAGLVVLAWQVLFRLRLGVPFAPASAVTVVAVAVLAAPLTPWWQLVLAVSFGAVIGELIFGGWGRNVLSGAAVTLAFLSLSAPNTGFAEVAPLVAFACAPAALLLALTGILPVAAGLGGVAGFAVVVTALGVQAEVAPALGAMVFCLVFILCEPVTAAATTGGRWIYGGAAGALAALLLAGPATAGQAAVFACLLGQIFAPLIDQGVIALGRYQRSRHHG